MVLVFFLLQIILIAFRLNCYGIKITNNSIDLKLINISYFLVNISDIVEVE